MPCYNPIEGYRSKKVNESGKRSIVFDRSEGYGDLKVSVPCGQCIGCRLEKSRQWAMRMVNEASLHDQNCFITLTYNPESLPSNNSLDKKHFQLFMKKLRKKYPSSKIRYYHCGEYGEQLNRPHYHACIFNFDFPDKTLHSTRDGIRLYTSESLTKIWGKGFCTIGDLTFESAAYTARYVTKKMTGPKAADHYTVTDPDTGEVFDLQPEYATMSRRPGIGLNWIKKFTSDCYPRDVVHFRGKKMKPPKFYDDYFEKENPETMKLVKYKRKLLQFRNKADNTPKRLFDKQMVKKAQSGLLKRGLEKI